MPWNGRMEFREDIFAPASAVKIEFVGKNPMWISFNSLKMFREVLKLSAKDLREDDVRWDITGEMREFYGIWRAKRGEDKWTSTWAKITAHGFMGKDYNGNVKIKLEGWLATKFKWKNPFAHWLWVLYNYMFYWRQRRTYLDHARDDLLIIREQIMRAYGILKE